jgi:hypothetical protein
MRRLLLTCVCVLSLGAMTVGGQPTRPTARPLIDPSRRIDWTQAGVVGGIPTRTTQCGSTIAAYSGTAATINTAIASCASGQVVQLGAGTFNLSTGVTFNGRSNVTLRGAGANRTFLVFADVDSCGGYFASICVLGNGNWYGGSVDAVTNWTGGFAKGTTQITVASTTGFSVGAVAVLDQLNDTTDTGGVIVCDTTGPPECSREGLAGGRTDRAQEQYVKITAISGNVLTITPGLHMSNWRSGQSPQVFIFGPQAELDGVENLSLDHGSAGGKSGIAFSNAYNGWVTGVRSVNGPRNHVWLIQAAHIEVRDNYFYGAQGTGSQSYAVESFGASDALIQNNIFQQTTLPMLIGNNTGSVYAYNYSTNNVYTNPDIWMQPGILLHDAGVDSLLLEGNDSQGLEADLFHGMSSFITIFRNAFSGWQTGKTINTVPIQILAKHRFFNVVGNVLGTATVHNSYQDITPSGTNGNTSIYDLGWSGQVGDTDDSGIPNDPLVATTLMRWGNYDTVTGTSRFVNSEVPTGLTAYAQPLPPSQHLPASLYLRAKPSFFGAIPWPPIGPDVTGGDLAGLGGHAFTIPARRCYTSVMGGPATGTGAVLPFDPTACY